MAMRACAAGYHMASIYEILNPSNLKYDIKLGWTLADSGEGPPTASIGWIRTGFASSGQTSIASTPGQDNCRAWTTANPGFSGTVVALSDSWVGQSQLITPIVPYFGELMVCSAPIRVWCVQD